MIIYVYYNKLIMLYNDHVCIGYDEGTAVIKLGNEKPVASLDTNTGIQE